MYQSTRVAEQQNSRVVQQQSPRVVCVSFYLKHFLKTSFQSQLIRVFVLNLYSSSRAIGQLSSRGVGCVSLYPEPLVKIVRANSLGYLSLISSRVVEQQRNRVVCVPLCLEPIIKTSVQSQLIRVLISNIYLSSSVIGQQGSRVVELQSSRVVE